MLVVLLKFAEVGTRAIFVVGTSYLLPLDQAGQFGLIVTLQGLASFAFGYERHTDIQRRVVGAEPWTFDRAVGQALRLFATNYLVVSPIYAALLLILLMFVIMGCFLDAMAMVILMVPIVFPVITELGFDPIWFGVIIVMTVELGLITPPVGMNVFVINSITPGVSLPAIFRGVMPFVAVDVLRLLLLIAFPAIVLFLPSGMH